MTKLLITVNVAIYVLSVLLSKKFAGEPSGVFSFFAPDSALLQVFGWASPSLYSNFAYWSLVTSLFLHGGLLHIGFNMLWLYDIYPKTELLYGRLNTFSIYILTGIVGAAAATLFGAAPVIGASGAIFGLLASYIVAARQSGNIMHQFVSQSYLKYGLVILILGFLIPGISNLSHLGGAIGGYLLGKTLLMARPRLGSQLTLFVVSAALVVASFSVSIYRIYSYLF